MDVAASDELLGELLDLTRRLRSQLARHAALGAWAAPGGASTRIAEVLGEAEPQDAGSAGDEAPPGVAGPLAELAAPHGAMAAGPRHAAPITGSHAGADATAGERGSGAAASPRGPHAGVQRPGDLTSGAAVSEPPAGTRHPGGRDAEEPWHATAGSPSRDPHVAEQQPGDRAAAAVGEAPVALGRRTLPQVRAELGECTRCKLHSTRRSIVFGVGAPDTPLMFVGEAPGEQEDRRGEPFVGPAGQLLDKMIEAMGWTRAAVYIANTTKCRPPGNRNPQPDELAQCMPFLHGQIAAIAPRIIVALGRPAANQLLGTDAPISALRGRFHDYALPSGGVRLKIMPTFHPAYLLRDPSKKRTAWEDLKLVMAELERLGIAPPAAPRG